MSEQKSSLGVIGLAVMGTNLAKNFASRGIKTSVFNRSYDKTELLLSEHNPDLYGFKTLESFVESLEKPRKVILMVKSGAPVDQFIEKLYPLLEGGDVIIDCGNSNWKDTQKRIDALENGKIFSVNEMLNYTKSNEQKVIHFVGCGVSGGEEGALHGPSIMPGGRAEVVNALLPFFEKIAAKDFAGRACVTNVGLGSAGHFVKMVHNGIEYALMQGISEIYAFLASVGYNQEKLIAAFTEVNRGQMKSYLLDITIDILKTKTADGMYVLDMVDGKAQNKGTGRRTTEAALELGVATPTLTQGLFARLLSNSKFNGIAPTLTPSEHSKVDISVVSGALEQIFLASFLQGLELITEANEVFGWGVDIAEMCRIWQGGCIIRTELLPVLARQLVTGEDVVLKLEELLYVQQHSLYVPKPVINSTIDYVLIKQGYTLKTNLIQAQRDYFGAHTFKRTDQEGDFTGGWFISA